MPTARTFKANLISITYNCNFHRTWTSDTNYNAILVSLRCKAFWNMTQQATLPRLASSRATVRPADCIFSWT